MNIVLAIIGCMFINLCLGTVFSFSEYLLQENYPYYGIDAKTMKGHAIKELYLRISKRGRTTFLLVDRIIDF